MGPSSLNTPLEVSRPITISKVHVHDAFDENECTVVLTLLQKHFLSISGNLAQMSELYFFEFGEDN